MPWCPLWTTFRDTTKFSSSRNMYTKRPSNVVWYFWGGWWCHFGLKNVRLLINEPCTLFFMVCSEKWCCNYLNVASRVLFFFQKNEGANVDKWFNSGAWWTREEKEGLRAQGRKVSRRKVIERGEEWKFRARGEGRLDHKEKCRLWATALSSSGKSKERVKMGRDMVRDLRCCSYHS